MFFDTWAALGRVLVIAPLAYAALAQRVTREEVLALLRASGETEPGKVAAVVLEADRSFSVLSHAPTPGRPGTLGNVPRASQHA